MRRFSILANQLSIGMAGVLLVAACSRNEPQAAAVDPSVAGAAQKLEAESPSGASREAHAAPGTPASPAPAEVTPAAPEEGLPGFDEALARRKNAPLVRPTAEVTVDGTPWDSSEDIKVSGSDLWIGFVVELESSEGDKFTIQVPRGASKGERVTDSDINVAYVRGKETWLKAGDETAASVTNWQDDGPRPIVSLDCTATLRRERRPGKLMVVEARVANVPISANPKTPELGLEKTGY